MINLNLSTDSNNYIEADQSSQVKFSIIKKENDEYNQVYIPFKCRDYLTEMVISRKVKRILPRIYGFQGKEVWDYKDLLLSVSSENKSEIDCIVNSFYIVNKTEEMMGINKRRRSKLYPTQYEDTYIIKFPSEWVYSPIMMSAYTLIIRSLSMLLNKNKDIENYKSFVKVIKEDYDDYHNDCNLVSYMYTPKFDLDIFLTNYKEILVDPLTGVNDRAFRIIGTTEPKYFSKSVVLANRLYPRSMTWCVDDSHNYSGIYTLAYQLKYDKTQYMNIGHNWAKKYLEITNG